jgi:hypothetical protein
MAKKRKKGGSTKKQKQKKYSAGKTLSVILRRLTVPFLLLCLIGISLAAMFYIIFLHSPATPLF